MKKYKVSPTYSKKSSRIHACEECGEDLVIFKKKWVCRYCMKLPTRGEFGKTEQIPFGVLYPSREYRRKK